MLMKIFFQSVCCICLSLLLQNGACAQTFKIATLSPDGSYWMQRMRAGADRIEQQTSGRVKFKFYPGGIMGDDDGVLRKIRLRQLHGAALSSSALSDVYPDIQIYNLVLKFASLAEIDYIRSKMDEKLIEELEKQGFVSSGFAEVGMVYIMSTVPIQSLEQMRSNKVWVPSKNFIALEAMKAFQIAPIPLPLRDVLVGLQTGMINVAAAPPTAAIALQWHTKIQYVSDFPLMYSFGVFVLDKKTFARLALEDQQIVRTILREIAADIDQRSRQDNLDAIKALKANGIAFLPVNAAEREQLIQTAVGANQNIERAGRITAEKINQLNAYLREFRQRL